jgi:hypothetical protein
MYPSGISWSYGYCIVPPRRRNPRGQIALRFTNRPRWYHVISPDGIVCRSERRSWSVELPEQFLMSHGSAHAFD